MEGATGTRIDLGADSVCDEVRYSGDTGAFNFACGGAPVMLEVAIYTLFPHCPHL